MTKKVQVMECEVYSRVCGYMRPLQSWNVGKRAEFEERHFLPLKTKYKEDKNPDLINIEEDNNNLVTDQQGE